MSADYFICHASEDKDGFVRRLADELRRAGVTVWYDEFSLRLGDSLRENIDKGLAQSRFGIVVLSENFFSKRWTSAELNALVAREMIEGRKVVLPIWFGVDATRVSMFSPVLADRLAVQFDGDYNYILSRIL